MKKQILAFLLGIAITVSLAATTNSIMVFKPAKPTATVSYFGYYPNIFTLKWASKGYVVVSSSCGHYNTYVVMVKY